MNDLNESKAWNVPFEKKGGGGGGGDGGGGGGGWAGPGSKWNLALLVPLVCLAAFRWVWSREARREQEAARFRYHLSLEGLRAEQNRQYRSSVRNARRENARLGLELEQERNRAQGYRQAVVSQVQQVGEVRRQLLEERRGLEEEQMELGEGGATGSILRTALQEAAAWALCPLSTLQHLEEQLLKRQELLCSRLVPRRRRVQVEQELLLRAAREHAQWKGAGLDLEAGLRDIFENDSYCGQYLNRDPRSNGSLMWAYLRLWQQHVAMETHRRAHAALVGARPDHQSPPAPHQDPPRPA